MEEKFNIEEMRKNFYEIFGLAECKFEDYNPNIKHGKENTFILERLILNEINLGESHKKIAEKYQIQLHTVHRIRRSYCWKLYFWKFTSQLQNLLKFKCNDNIITSSDINEIIPNYGILIINLFTCSWFNYKEENKNDFLNIDNSYLNIKNKEENAFKINIIEDKSQSWKDMLNNWLTNKTNTLYKSDLLNMAKRYLTFFTRRGYTNLTIEDVFNYIESLFNKVGKKYQKRK